MTEWIQSSQTLILLSVGSKISSNVPFPLFPTNHLQLLDCQMLSNVNELKIEFSICVCCFDQIWPTFGAKRSNRWRWNVYGAIPRRCDNFQAGKLKFGNLNKQAKINVGKDEKTQTKKKIHKKMWYSFRTVMLIQIIQCLRSSKRGILIEFRKQQNFFCWTVLTVVRIVCNINRSYVSKW